ncbi:MAG: DUF2497 domain-containing protein [Alphaproteobacteria bacterium]|nr:DUF2497 domain-containing protein [Alphaproteobacteria bacterium]
MAMYEQEPSVNDILSSIRQILSNKIEGTDETSVVSDSMVDNVEISNEQEKALMQATDVFLLTPTMQVQDEQKKEETRVIRDNSKNYFVPSVNSSIQQEASSITTEQYLQEPVQKVALDIQEQDVKPLVQEWLDKNLPDLVERIVAEEVRRIFNKR